MSSITRAPQVAAPVYVVGGGPGGLATAAALAERGVRAIVLERSPAVGASWRAHYDRLRLHTTRRMSALPGMPIPRAYGRWVSRDDMVRYLERYVEHHRLEVVTGVRVTRIDHAATADRPAPRHPGAVAGQRAGDWLLRATGGRELTSPVVVVATGFNHTPHLPDWPGRREYHGSLSHAAHYRNARPYQGKDVLVVGAGNTGAEIATDLAAGGAARVRLAVRTPPHIVRRSTVGWPAQANGVLARRLPTGLVDRGARALSRLSVPDLSTHGLPRPSREPGAGLYSRARAGAIPVQDVGLVAAIRAGRVEVVPSLTAFEGERVVLADGSDIAPQAVIAATGYRRGLADLVGHLDLLDARGRPRAHGRRTLPGAEGLYFLGYTNPISGMLRELAIDARRIAKAVAHAIR